MDEEAVSCLAVVCMGRLWHVCLPTLTGMPFIPDSSSTPALPSEHPGPLGPGRAPTETVQGPS
jgi:hypothetical protein